ncbi:MAG: sigma 54-interacting transcriptional regulator [Spirochaetaceae bacterium]|jgi:Nif-specific regulatory protein|nr:sigma 54-interacting transcriptional regulator [Spirochaetaceae bacterium]
MKSNFSVLTEEGKKYDSDMRELELLFDIARTLDKYVELRSALGPVLSILEVRASLKYGMITLLNRGTGLLKIEEAYGLTPEEKERGIYRLGEGLVGRVFETGIAVSVPDLSKEERFLNRAKNRKREDMAGMSYCCVPIRASGGVIGTLSAERRLSVNNEENPDAEKIMLHDKILLEKVAAIISDSAKLRERIMEEQFRADLEISDGGGAALVKKNGKELACTNLGRIDENSAMIGTSSAIRDMYALVGQVAPTDANVLITGESGTGKELVAAEIFRLSKRNGKPFLKVNCAALPESVIESELFGHEKGAFTGAISQRKGRFEMADTGTIFLDEIGELPPQIQVKLLRVIQERDFERVGGTQTIKVDVRIIAASNRNLEEEVKAGRFREDLFYRLNVFMLHTPPLRQRKSDIMLLADYFTEKYSEKNGKLIKRISSLAIDLLTNYHWPGNVRELENCIERAVILSRDMVIHSYNLPPSLQSAASTNTELTTTLDAALSRLEKEMITESLKNTEGNMSAAARILGITERQMGLRIHHYGINWRAFRKEPRVKG